MSYIIFHVLSISSDFSHAIRNEESLSAEILARAFASARDTAYKGVVRPVEGTMLTVIKDVAAATEAAVEKTKDPVEMLEIAVEAAAESGQPADLDAGPVRGGSGADDIRDVT